MSGAYNHSSRDVLIPAAHASHNNTASQLVSELTKAINVATLDDYEEVRASLFASKPIIGEMMFDKLNDILDAHLVSIGEQAGYVLDETDNEETA